MLRGWGQDTPCPAPPGLVRWTDHPGEGATGTLWPAWCGAATPPALASLLPGARGSACRRWHFPTPLLPHSDAHSAPHLPQPGGPCAGADGVHQGLPGVHGVAEGAGAGPGRCPGCRGRGRRWRRQCGRGLAGEVLQPRGPRHACGARRLTEAPELLRGTGRHLEKTRWSDHTPRVPSKGSTQPCPEPGRGHICSPALGLPPWQGTEGKQRGAVLSRPTGTSGFPAAWP